MALLMVVTPTGVSFPSVTSLVEVDWRFVNALVIVLRLRTEERIAVAWDQLWKQKHATHFHAVRLTCRAVFHAFYHLDLVLIYFNTCKPITFLCISYLVVKRKYIDTVEPTFWEMYSAKGSADFSLLSVEFFPKASSLRSRVTMGISV